jgi:hypothetical protein
MAAKRRTRGLPAIARAREDRRLGRARWTTPAGLVAAGAIVASFFVHKVISQHDLSAGKEALLSKERAVANTLGAEWFPLRDRVEGEVLEAAKEYRGDMVDPAARRGDFRTQPGLYLRMRVVDGSSVARVREVAADAQRDAFAACLLREPNERGLRGEIKGGAFAEQPWNLGQAYAATRILSDTWIEDLRTADDELRLRLFQAEYDKAVREDIPVAVDVVRRAKFFLLVLDEDGTIGGSPTTEQALQLVPHPARVHILDLASGTEILRLRRSGEARVIQAGERVIVDPEMRDALTRQANNCALAARVQEWLSPGDFVP